MANTNIDALIDSIRARTRRQNDSTLITENFVLASLNKGQVEIVKRCPRLLDLDKKSLTDYRLSSAKTVAIGGCVRSSNVVTVTTSAAHYFQANQEIVLEDVDSGSETNAFSGTHTIASVPTTTTFTFAQTGADESNLAAGTATAISIYVGTLNPAHIGGIWILNNGSTRQRGLDYVPLPEFRRKYIPVIEESAAEPTKYTRQGKHIIFNCPAGSDYNGLYLHIDYTGWATTLTNAAVTSDLSESDDGLIFYAMTEIYREISLTNPSIARKSEQTWAWFLNWLDEYMEWNYSQLEELYE